MLTQRSFVMAWLFAAMLVISGFMSVTGQAQEDSERPLVRTLTVDGAIGPATSDYLQRGIESAAADGAELIVIRMDTPGGLSLSMRDIIQTILDSPVPVATYVAPAGARAASAGTYILYGSHIAAMAPTTSLGAATPVQLGGGDTPGLPGQESPQDASPTEGSGNSDGSDATSDNSSSEEEAGATRSASERKALNDALAYIRGLAERSGRNAEWAEAAVRDAATLSASEALERNVIEIVANDLQALLAQLDGRSINMGQVDTTLSTSEARIESVEPDWRTEFLSIITNPNLILVLSMVGIYGLILEFYNPGFGFAGVTGLICLLLAGYGLQLLPLSYAGLGLVLLGLTLIVAEAFAPSFGILGIGGIIAFSIGSIILVDTDYDMYQVSLPIIAAIATLGAIIIAVTIRLFMRIRRKPPVSGVDNLVGDTGICTGDCEREALVRVQGELWQATTSAPLKRGDRVRIDRVDGLHLHVSPITSNGSNKAEEIAS